MNDNPIPRIISSFDDRVIRLYSRVRFQVIRQEFIETIGSQLPEDGKILDLGCGFGLFSLYYASESPARHVMGVDHDAYRIHIARNAAQKLGLNNVMYEIADVKDWNSDEKFSAIYALDLIHHLPESIHQDMIARCKRMLAPEGVMIVKDVGTRPWWKREFTRTLDRLMARDTPICYRSREDMVKMLEDAGLECQVKEMRDYLPYPHIVYFARPGK